MTHKRLVPFLVVLVLLGFNIFQFNQLKSIKRNYDAMSKEMFLSLKWFEWNNSATFEDMQKDNLQTQLQAAIFLGELLKNLDYTERFFTLIGIDSHPVKILHKEISEWNREVKAQLFLGQPLTETQKEQAKHYQAELSRVSLIVEKIMQQYHMTGSFGNAITTGEKKLYDLFTQLNSIFSSALQTKTQ